MHKHKQTNQRCIVCDYLNQDHPGMTEVHSEGNIVLDYNGEPMCTDCIGIIGATVNENRELAEGELENLEEDAENLLTSEENYDNLFSMEVEKEFE